MTSLFNCEFDRNHIKTYLAKVDHFLQLNFFIFSLLHLFAVALLRLNASLPTRAGVGN